MKKIITAFVCALLLVSCNKEELISNKEENKIVGSWLMVEKSYNGEAEDLTGIENIAIYYDNDKVYADFEGFHYGQTIQRFYDYEVTQDFWYAIYEKGTILNINGAEAELTKLTKNKLEFQVIAGTETLVYKYERIKD